MRPVANGERQVERRAHERRLQPEEARAVELVEPRELVPVDDVEVEHEPDRQERERDHGQHREHGRHRRPEADAEIGGDEQQQQPDAWASAPVEAKLDPDMQSSSLLLSVRLCHSPRGARASVAHTDMAQEHGFSTVAVCISDTGENSLTR